MDMKDRNTEWARNKLQIKQDLNDKLQLFLTSCGIETEILADAIDSVLAEVREDFDCLQTQILGLILWRVFAGESGLWIGCRTPDGNAIPASVLVMAYEMWHKAMGFAGKRGVDSLTAASALIQSTYATVDSLAKKDNPVKDVRKYLFGTYTNKISKISHKLHEREQDVQIEEVALSDSGILFNRIEDKILCRELLNIMPPQGRRVVALRHYLGLDWDEIAVVMGISVNAAQKALSAGVKKAFGVCMKDLRALGNPGRKRFKRKKA
jgi:RNA polymerase sigma factor (sigma-70 family)